MIIHIAGRDQTILVTHASGSITFKLGSTFPMSDYDRYHAPSHSAKEDAGRIFDLQGNETPLIALTTILHEARPVIRTRYQALKVAQHLATIADAQRESV